MKRLCSALRWARAALVRGLWLAFGLLPGLAAGPSVVAATNPLAGSLLITGSSTMAPLVTAMAERFHALHPGVRIEVQTGGSGRGMADAREGKADIGMVSRALGEAERGLHGLPIARDGVAIVVHQSNPVRALSEAQVAGIYTGRIGNWKQVGGLDALIVTIAAEPGRSSTELFSQHFHLDSDAIKARHTVGDNAERRALLAAQPNGIVWMSVGEAERHARAGAPIRSLPMGGVAATSRNIRAGSYPISRPLTLVTRGRPAGLARAFVEYCLSSQVTDVVIAHDFVPYLD